MNRYSPFARVESTLASFNLILPEVPLNFNRFELNFFLDGKVVNLLYSKVRLVPVYLLILVT